jgi:hypothetical protein
MMGASRQNATSMVFDTREDSNLRDVLRMTANR